MLQIKVILVLYNYFKFLFLSNLLAGLLLCTLTKLQKYISKPNFESRDRILETHIKCVSLYSWLLSQSHVFSIHAVIIHSLFFVYNFFCPLSFPTLWLLDVNRRRRSQCLRRCLIGWGGGVAWHEASCLIIWHRQLHESDISDQKRPDFRDFLDISKISFPLDKVLLLSLRMKLKQTNKVLDKENNKITSKNTVNLKEKKPANLQ